MGLCVGCKAEDGTRDKDFVCDLCCEPGIYGYYCQKCASNGNMPYEDMAQLLTLLGLEAPPDNGDGILLVLSQCEVCAKEAVVKGVYAVKKP